MESHGSLRNLTHQLRDEELKLLQTFRASRRAKKITPIPPDLTTGDRIADIVAASVGSWPFIIIQSLLLVVWMMLNVTAYIRHWDPYPFILLNLVLSFQAAYSAPFIMMSQNRQAVIDRLEARGDYNINIKAELEIELLHQKFDQLREAEVSQMLELVEGLTARLAEAAGARPHGPAVPPNPG